MVLPESMVSVQKYHHIKDVVLDDNEMRSAMLIVMAYIVTFTIGTLAGMLCGYPFGLAAFEAASVTGNVGLSIGVTAAAMPAVLKVIYIIIMWLARLEFMSILALGAYIATKVKKKCTVNDQHYWCSRLLPAYPAAALGEDQQQRADRSGEGI